jgi:hypothetical protein
MGTTSDVIEVAHGRAADRGAVPTVVDWSDVVLLWYRPCAAPRGRSEGVMTLSEQRDSALAWSRLQQEERNDP